MTNLIELVWGTKEGECCWCLEREATKSYLGIDSQDELVNYQVCNACYVEFAPNSDGSN